MADMDEAAKAPDSKRWQCGDPYQYSIPETGDHWANVLAPLMERDKTQCEIWKDEVQNLLIFAGLFSGVLSAFLIQSIQGLQQDPNDIKIALLAHIATRLDNPLNGTASVPKPIDVLLSPTSPAASSIRTNIFWFISLVLSLTTVLIGIISMQWLREHQQYPKSLSSKETFALFNMRAEGLEAWYVPQIFSALPLLLQSALILFLVGMVDFLLVFGMKVAIPVIIVMGIPLAFLIWTTVMPAFQVFIFCLPIGDRTDCVPQQCPYKSPQSRIIRYMLTFSQRTFLFYARSIIAVHSAVTLRLWKDDAVDSDSEQLDTSTNKYALTVLENICTIWSKKTWLSFDGDWLVMRDAYGSRTASAVGKEWTSFVIRIYTSTSVGPLYDLTRGLSSTAVENENSTVQFSAYHCVQDLTLSVIGNQSRVYDDDVLQLRYNRYLQKLLGSAVLHREFPTFSGLLEKTDIAFLEDENAFIFLSRYSKPFPVVLQHFAELHIRILNYLYPETPHTDISDSMGEHPDFPRNQWEETYGKWVFPRKQYGAAFDIQLSAQFSFAIDAFFKTAADSNINDTTFLTSFHGQKLGDILSYAILRQSQSAIPSTLDFLSANIGGYTDGKFGERSDFIFYASAFYARSLMIPNPLMFNYGSPGDGSWHVWHDNPILEPFLPILRNYIQDRGVPNLALGKRLGIPIPSDDWWGFLNHSPEEDQNRNQQDLAMVVPNPRIIDTSQSNHDNPLTVSTDAPTGQHLNAGSEEGSLPVMSHDAGDLV